MELQLETVRRQHEGERGQLKNKIAGVCVCVCVCARMCVHVCDSDNSF